MSHSALSSWPKGFKLFMVKQIRGVFRAVLSAGVPAPLFPIRLIEADDAPEGPVSPGFFVDGEGGGFGVEAGVFEVDVFPAVGADGGGDEDVGAFAAGVAEHLFGVEVE